MEHTEKRLLFNYILTVLRFTLLVCMRFGEYQSLVGVWWYGYSPRGTNCAKVELFRDIAETTRTRHTIPTEVKTIRKKSPPCIFLHQTGNLLFSDNNNITIITIIIIIISITSIRFGIRGCNLKW
ncbi:hypothetical protein LSH36_555g04075 [Paralvinella palmiformis]|uniref:Uncharacterized protein n=1 Tax=Paralvinella palmiformis TaxID=53620 RepID=A0AAD9MVK4_9ANNE|nr:hypothetical protein LSH36_555g04075 [Paralvinella palmiformis]